MKTKRLSVLLVAVLALLAFTVPVAAQETTSGSGSDDNSTSSTTSETTEGTSHKNRSASSDSASSTREAEKAEKKAEIENRRKEHRQSLCKKRETRINAKMSRIVNRGQRQLDLFTTIATRVENFYVKKGKMLDNYDALVANVNAKKDSAQQALDTLKGTQVSFKCDGTDPKGSADAFKSALRTEQQALKEYKTAVKDLIVGVKSVQSTSNSADSNSDSATNSEAQ